MRDQASEQETVSAPSHGHPGGGRGARPAELSCRLHSLQRRVWTGHYRNAEAERANSACGEWARSQDNAGSARIFIGLTAGRRGPDLIAFNLAEHHLVTLQERAVDFQEENETEGTGNGLQSGARASGSSFAHLCRENSGRGHRDRPGVTTGGRNSPHTQISRESLRQTQNALCKCLGLCTSLYLWETSPGRGASRGFRGARQRSQDLKTGRREPDSAEREEEGRSGNRASRRAGREGAGEAGRGRGGRGEVRTVGPGAPADHADNYGKREVERASGTDRPALARRRGCRSRRGRWFARPRRPARCAGGARKRTRVGLSGNSPGPLPATRGAPGCRQRSPFQRLSQRGADESLPKREGRGQTPRPWPTSLLLSAPRPPEATPLYTSCSPSRK